MRIAYKNLLKTATLSATNENANYPVENLYHIWKRKLFKATSSSVITVTLDEISDITAVLIAYHNLTSCTVDFYDSGDTLLDTWTMDTDNLTDAQYGTVSSVSYAEVTCASSGDIEIGTLFIGDSIYSLIEADQNIPLLSTDVVNLSSDRQISGRGGSVTRGGTVTIPLLSASEREEIEDCFYECGLITPFFLDLWDASHDSFKPLYCVFTSNIEVTHAYEGDKVTFSIQEVN